MTYENAFEILGSVRKGINDFTDARWKGTDTTSPYDNNEILKRINDAQRWLYNIILVRKPEFFLTSISLTVTSGYVTLPSDYYRMRRLEDSDGYQLIEKDVDQLRLSGETGSRRFYYWLNNRIYFDFDSPSDPTLYYLKRVRDLTAGMSSAGGAKSITLATSAKKIADYYNGLSIENYTADWVDTISDYTAARVCTLSAETASSSQYYGLVSELPEAFHSFIARKAVLLMKQNYKALGPASRDEINDFNIDLGEAISGFLGTIDANQDISELFE